MMNEQKYRSILKLSPLMNLLLSLVITSESAPPPPSFTFERSFPEHACRSGKQGDIF